MTEKTYRELTGKELSELLSDLWFEHFNFANDRFNYRASMVGFLAMNGVKLVRLEPAASVFVSGHIEDET